jgi:DNA-binding IclR family transcriptional regulator
VASGLLVQGAGRQYQLGQFAYELGLVAGAHFQLRERCAPSLERIAEETGDTVFLVMRSGFDAFCLDRKTGSFPVKVFTLEVGNRQPLGVGAGGLALLSFLSEAERQAALAHNEAILPGYNGLTSELLADLVQRTRDCGHALMVNHAIAGVTGVGMPVLDRIGRPLVAISVTTVSDRMTAQRQQAALSILRREIGGLREALSAMGPGWVSEYRDTL